MLWLIHYLGYIETGMITVVKKMNVRSLLLSLLMTSFLSGCGNSLVDDIYAHSRHGDSKDTITAFITLSNIALTESDLEKITNDYAHEEDQKRKYLYEYLLAKRTQEEKYIQAFISNSKNNVPLLIKDNSHWISIGSPFVESLAYYSKTDDEALSTLFELIDESDASNLSIVMAELLEIYNINPDRFAKIAEKSGFQKDEILMLMEDE